MDTKHKGDYASPTITVVEIQMQQVLCESTIPKFGEQWTWDGEFVG